MQKHKKQILTNFTLDKLIILTKHVITIRTLQKKKNLAIEEYETKKVYVK